MGKSSKEDVEENWNSVWKKILENPDGSINKEQLKLELMDFANLIHRMTTLTCEITGHRLSYPTYPVKTILEVHEQVKEEAIEQQKKDDLEDGECSMCGHFLGTA